MVWLFIAARIFYISFNGLVENLKPQRLECLPTVAGFPGPQRNRLQILNKLLKIKPNA
jgi:hypothetical protein